MNDGKLLAFVKVKGHHTKRARKRLKLARKEQRNANQVRSNKTGPKN